MNRRRLIHTAREVLPFVEPERLDVNSWTCGTSACAFGWECRSRFGRAQGLRLDAIPTYQGTGSFTAVAAYYEIGIAEAGWIFSPANYADNPSPSQVAERIESLLACGE